MSTTPNHSSSRPYRIQESDPDQLSEPRILLHWSGTRKRDAEQVAKVWQRAAPWNSYSVVCVEAK